MSDVPVWAELGVVSGVLVLHLLLGSLLVLLAWLWLLGNAFYAGLGWGLFTVGLSAIPFPFVIWLTLMGSDVPPGIALMHVAPILLLVVFKSRYVKKPTMLLIAGLLAAVPSLSWMVSHG